ncbi:hypothetical protein CGLO_07218 [Colletotrichum gloeosporioides Cg-14]|uniref:Uncharacterized protein n=1 Tax=Colletotrichum gloeosporioides (strain Cg-14) TaxID=1237896 RepID=T0LXG6_COLGC|nr:hypothetical protein CGLO_07218 [Colletotrichum gloeosporioides Cg-14]
MAEKRWLL